MRGTKKTIRLYKKPKGTLFINSCCVQSIRIQLVLLFFFRGNRYLLVHTTLYTNDCRIKPALNRSTSVILMHGVPANAQVRENSNHSTIKGDQTSEYGMCRQRDTSNYGRLTGLHININRDRMTDRE